MLNLVRITFYTLILAALVAINFSQLNLTKAQNSPITAPISTPITSPEVTPTPEPTNPPSDNHDNGGSNSGGSNGGNSGPSVCGDQKPGTPVLISVIKTGPNQVKLTWSKPVGPVTAYVLAYGLTPAKMLYGNPNVGNVNSSVVNNLQANTAYYFQVRAANNCMPGAFSNTLGVSAYGKIVNVKAATGFQPGVLSTKTVNTAVKAKTNATPKASSYQPTIPEVKYEAPVENKAASFLDNVIYKAIRFFYR